MEGHADRLGIGERQLRRLFLQHLGASPVSVAQTRRVLFAKQLIHETRMSMTEVALASGFGSLRRFNEVFQTLFHRPPRTLRRKTLATELDTDSGVSIRLRHCPPYDWDSILQFFEKRAIRGVEIIKDGKYLRTIEIDKKVGSIEVTHLPKHNSLGIKIRFPDVRSFPTIVARVRRLFDIGAVVAARGRVTLLFRLILVLYLHLREGELAAAGLPVMTLHLS